MEINFHKYEGAGNDFIIIDGRDNSLHLSEKNIGRLCHRRFGIGADGLILLRLSEEEDFKMIYFNADGRESSFCGNGGRCIADYAHRVLKIVGKEMDFIAIDGKHRAKVQENNRVTLSMMPVKQISFNADCVILDTGSPHFVKFVKGLNQLDVFKEGRKIRNQPEFQPAGINVNFLEQENGEYFLRTYERGVEDETFACGTGVTAAAIALSGQRCGHFEIPIITKVGHRFQVSFDKNKPESAENILLSGPITLVFQGQIQRYRILN